jgi:hypothetical protein
MSQSVDETFISVARFKRLVFETMPIPMLMPNADTFPR